MQLTIRTKGVFLTLDLERFVRAKTWRATHRFLGHIRTADILLCQENIPGVSSQRCRLSVQMLNGATLLASGLHHSIQGAVCMASQKLTRNISRICRKSRPLRCQRFTQEGLTDG